MKQNIYDQNNFFEKYAQMNRSIQGLQGAGEWETLKSIMPNLKEKSFLDLGCGYGWHCIYAAEQGAENIVGIDISHKMLEIAKEKTAPHNVEYICTAMEDMDFITESFDVVLSSLALHYIKSFDNVVLKIHRYLKTGGYFIFSVEHPVFTAEGSQNWFYNENGEIAHFPVDNYYYEGERKACFLGEEVIKYHRTLTTYINTLLENGFMIKTFVEPQPPQDMIENIDGMADEMRRPMMLIISAIKL